MRYCIIKYQRDLLFFDIIPPNSILTSLNEPHEHPNHHNIESDHKSRIRKLLNRVWASSPSAVDRQTIPERKEWREQIKSRDLCTRHPFRVCGGGGWRIPRHTISRRERRRDKANKRKNAPSENSDGNGCTRKLRARLHDEHERLGAKHVNVNV